MTQEIYSNNLLQINGFTFTLDRIPQTTFRLTSCDLPEITVPAPEVSSGSGNQFFPGTANEFEPLTIEFLVDEDLKNYKEIYRWITQQKYTTKEFTPKEKEYFLVSDGALLTMTNSSNPNIAFNFKDLFPVSLGGLRFSTTVDQPTPVTCTATFRYSYFEIR